VPVVLQTHRVDSVLVSKPPCVQLDTREVKEGPSQSTGLLFFKDEL